MSQRFSGVAEVYLGSENFYALLTDVSMQLEPFTSFYLLCIFYVKNIHLDLQITVPFFESSKQDYESGSPFSLLTSTRKNPSLPFREYDPPTEPA